MNYMEIKKCDIANGPGVRVSLFVSGCTHHCKGCFQPETWDFAAGRSFTASTEAELSALLSPAYIAGLSLLGGEPMEPENRAVLTPFLERLRADLPNKTVWCYSGYTLEELLDCGAGDTLKLLDVLVDGEFVESKKNIRLPFRGSENQRVLDVPRSLEAGMPVWVEKYKM